MLLKETPGEKQMNVLPAQTESAGIFMPNSADFVYERAVFQQEFRVF